ncbi:MAG: Ig-like domain-containing protein [Chitinophagales bacterium]|nr:Ig-like domain-containing protein [Chitinophagales bacterium]
MCCLVISCATPGLPEGGPKDTYEPFPKKFNPLNYSTNFNNDKITVQFDEWVQVANLNQNLIISPPILPQPDVKVKKNLLTIDFKNPLDSNTTYSIDFGNSIKDINEGNILSNFKYIFSTGSFLDSLSIQGKVSTYSAQNIPENTFVLLYKSGDDSIITRQKPEYIYKIQKDNTFKIDYLPRDSFRIFVLNDLNNNFIYDLPTEWVGKLDQPILLDSTQSDIELFVDLPEVKDLKVLNSNFSNINKILTIELNKEVNPQKDSIFLQNFTFNSYKFLNTDFTSKFLSFFIYTNSLSDTCELFINDIIVDSLRFSKPSQSLENEVFLPMAKMMGKDSILSAYKNCNFQFFSNVPISVIDKNKIFFVSEHDTIDIKNFSIQENQWGFRIEDTLSENFEGRILFLDSAIGFQNSSFSHLVSWPIHFVPVSNFGQVNFDVHLPSNEKSYILKFFKENGYLLNEYLVQGDTSFHLDTYGKDDEKFFIEVIEDLNHSATWNGYSFWNNIAPERVFKSELYSSKSNWENNYNINVDFSKKQLPTTIINWLNYFIKKNSKPTSKPQSFEEKNMNSSSTPKSFQRDK